MSGLSRDKIRAALKQTCAEAGLPEYIFAMTDTPAEIQMLHGDEIKKWKIASGLTKSRLKEICGEIESLGEICRERRARQA